MYERLESEEDRTDFDLKLLEPLPWQASTNRDKALREAEMKLFFTAKNNN